MTTKTHRTATPRRDWERSVRRRAGFELHANVRGAMAQATRRELKKRLFAGRELVPCCFCKRELTVHTATIEHILPKSRGGSSEIENLTLSCQPCNSQRGNMGYEKFRGRTVQGAIKILVMVLGAAAMLWRLPPPGDARRQVAGVERSGVPRAKA